MPQKVVKFTGINRIVNEFQASGACEELINLRPDVGGGLKIAKKKIVLGKEVEYDNIVEHSWGAVKNIIASHNGIVFFVNQNDFTTSIITDKFSNKSIKISSAGNVLLVFCEEDKQQLAFKYEDGKYVAFLADMSVIKSVKLSYSYSTDTLKATQNVIADNGTEEAYNEALQSAASLFYVSHPKGLCGASVIGFSYEMEDGSELWSTGFIVANITRHSDYVAPSVIQADRRVTVTGAREVTATIILSGENSSGIKKINVYASRPVIPYKIKRNQSGIDTSYTVEQVDLSDLELDGQQMFYQCSFSPDETSVDVKLKFNNQQAVERLMGVDSGCIERVGESISYNNRFHFFKSSVNHIVQVPSCTEGTKYEDSSSWAAIVQLKDKWILIDYVYYFSENSKLDIVYPMAGVKRIMFIRGSYDKGDFNLDYNDQFTVELSDSSAYNYSYAFDVTPDVRPFGDNMFDELSENNQTWVQAKTNGFTKRILWKEETNAINVSAPFNPFVCPVEYSYSFGGEIRDVITSYMPISATQVGQYPLTVFTGNGIYALEQGDGSTLYSNITPISPLVADGHAIPVPQGAFFISSNNLYLLAGRDTACVSTVLTGKLDLDIRDNGSYQTIVCNTSGSIHNFKDEISSVNFEEYINGATMLYDVLRNELYLSNPSVNCNYSYVFNIDTKSFYKSDKKYAERRLGSKYAIEYSNGIRNVVDMLTEIKSGEESYQSVLLQSRPFQLEALYTHIQRLVALVDAKLADGHVLVLSVFGSDNLKDWKCIINSQKEYTDIRQIRTNKAPKSYKDYIIVINGTVGVDTDLSDIIVDYTVVNRRLG